MQSKTDWTRLKSKAAISLRVEQDVLEWFKAQGPGYRLS